MSAVAICGIIIIVCVADSVFGAILLLACWECEINLYSPIVLYRSTHMNWFGCIFIYIIMHLLFPLIYIGLDFNLLFHIGGH